MMSFKIHPILFLLLPGLLIAFGYLRVSGDEGIQVTRELEQQAARFQVNQQIEGQAAEAQQQIANERYRSGTCLYTEQLSKGHYFTAVPPGSLVCDGYGWSARTNEYGGVTDMAYTSDQQVIRNFLGW